MLWWGGWREWIAPLSEFAFIGFVVLTAHVLRNVE